jgi:hypothetical protein
MPYREDADVAAGDLADDLAGLRDLDVLRAGEVSGEARQLQATC